MLHELAAVGGNNVSLELLASRKGTGPNVRVGAPVQCGSLRPLASITVPTDPEELDRVIVFAPEAADASAVSGFNPATPSTMISAIDASMPQTGSRLRRAFAILFLSVPRIPSGRHSTG